jgi:hypothetical protein
MLVALDLMAPITWRIVEVRGRSFNLPARWAPIEARWIAADLDAFDDAPFDESALAAAGRRIESWTLLDPALTGRVGVVRTSHLGIQIVAELARPRADPRRWRRTREAIELAERFETVALAECRAAGFVGGHADRTARAAGRYVRRPGPRIDKNDLPEVARLAFASADPIEVLPDDCSPTTPRRRQVNKPRASS